MFHLEKIKIVEYQPSLAAAVADMWNHSQEGWGGGRDVYTEERVRQSEENSVNINTYIAMEDDRAIGYCGMSEYREDTGALYIALLNVRDDYHGKKIGKQLVFKAIERTIELGWPRIDLYTWAGNTKAVPLYKKCGFFWEDRDDTVHLMNFIPTVLNTEAVKEFFTKADWYEDSVRPIEVKPDGDKVGEFDYYTYEWEKNGKRLRMEFERKGRGLRLIETDDYLISASVAKQNLVFGSQYAIQYHVVNKSGNPLELSFAGIDDQNIRFEWSKELNVTDESIIEANFFLNEIQEEQSIWRTHPTVCARVMINGKESFLKVGINPKFPAKISALLPDEYSFIDVASDLMLEIENHYDEAVDFSFQLPHASFIQFEENGYTVSLGANERRTIPVTYRLSDYGFYAPQVIVKATKRNGESFSFNKKLGVAFKGIGAKFHGETDDYWMICNGLQHVWLDKLNNRIIPGRSATTNTHEQTLYLFYPKIGKPFSSEFSKKRPEQVLFYEEGNAICFKASYRSGDFKNLWLHSVVKLFAEGIVEHHYEIENKGDVETSDVIWLNKSIRNDISYGFFPYDGQILELKGDLVGGYSVWESSKISENWIFNNNSNLPIGIAWDAEEKVSFENWYFFFEQQLGKILAHSVVKAKPLLISIGTFTKWQDFRNFAMKKLQNKQVNTFDAIQLYHNEHNPFVDDKTMVTFENVKMVYLDGKIEVSLDGNECFQQSLDASEEKRKFDFAIQLYNHKPLQVIKAIANLEAYHYERESLLVRKKAGKVHMELIEEEQTPVYRADNGIIEIKAAPEFSSSLFSLCYEGREWLASSFPKPTPKSWWNPWVGGIYNVPLGITTNSLLKEERHAQFVTLYDQFNNEWHGIKVTVAINKNEKLKGLTLAQYFLLMPGLPLLCQVTEVIQHTNRYMKYDQLYSQSSFKPVLDKDKHAYVNISNRSNEWQKYYAGKGELEVESEKSITIGYESRNEKLQVIFDESEVQSELFGNKEVLLLNTIHRLHIEHGKSTMTAPTFYMFNDKQISEEALTNLKKTRFNT